MVLLQGLTEWVFSSGRGASVGQIRGLPVSVGFPYQQSSSVDSARYEPQLSMASRILPTLSGNADLALCVKRTPPTYG